MQIIALPTLAAVSPAAWDRLGHPNHPFMNHAFLRGLEVSGSVGKGTGWHPLYVLVTDDFDRAALRDDDAPDQLGRLPDDVTLQGAAAAYIKTDSYGEFIFDWAWASFFQRQGAAYYPKLVVAAPFTPATGPRMLVVPGERADEVRRMLGQGLLSLARQVGASSVHWLFAPENEALALSDGGYFHRQTLQQAWTNGGYKTFDDFLATMRSRNRKAIRRERRIAQGHGLELGIFRGDEMDDDQWRAIDRLYRLGCGRYGSTPYLTEAFLVWLREHFADRVLCSMARDPNAAPGPRQWVAATLNFQAGSHLYGRYWGAEREYYALHFELGFYMLIERCIDAGWTRFEAGAGGRHKVKRGLQPFVVHSAHWIANEQLAPAIAHHVAAEAQESTELRELIAASSTRRRDA